MAMTRSMIAVQNAAIAVLKHKPDPMAGICISSPNNDLSNFPFFTPKAWRDRGESYGLNSKCIITHDGGDYAALFNLDYCEYALFDRMVIELEKRGYWAEQCTSWYTAIYSI